MARVISALVRTARKVHKCDASSLWNQAGMSENDCINSEQRLLLSAAEADGFKILRGQAYKEVRCVDGGHHFVWRERIGMAALCMYFDLYDDV